MFKRLMKMLSGLVPFWGRGAGTRDVHDDMPLASAPEPRRDAYSSILDFFVDRHDWMYPGSPLAAEAKEELRRMRTGGRRTSPALKRIIRIRPGHVGDTRAAEEELRLLRPAADASLRSPRAYIAPGNCVKLFFPRNDTTPRNQSAATTVRLSNQQAEALARILLKPGSDGIIVFDNNDGMLAVGWHERDGLTVAELRIWMDDEHDLSLAIDASRAARLGNDIGRCLDAMGYTCFKCGKLCDPAAGGDDEPWCRLFPTDHPGIIQFRDICIGCVKRDRLADSQGAVL